MNLYVAHARILHKEPPKVEGRSGLMILKVGREKPETEALIQTINQVIVRIPPHLTARAERLPVDSYVEVFGHAGGIVRRSPIDGKSHPSTEIVASNLQPAVVCDEADDMEHRLFNRWISIGLMRGVRTPKRESLPATVYVQVGRDRANRGRGFQHTGVIPMLAYGNQIERLTQFAENASVHLEGRVIGLMRRVPQPGAEGGFEAVLDAGLVIERSYPTALVAQRLFEAEQPRQPEAKEVPDQEAAST